MGVVWDDLPSQHQVLCQLKDQLMLIDYEPGLMSKQKQAHDILGELKKLQPGDLSMEELELYESLKQAATKVIYE